MKFKINVQPENPAHQDINSHAEDRTFSSAEGLAPDELRCLARDTVQTVAAGCEVAGAKDISHVKLFIEHATGFVHASGVGGTENITVTGRDGETVKRFRLVLNAVIYGLPASAIKKVCEQGLEAVQAQYGLTWENPTKTG